MKLNTLTKKKGQEIATMDFEADSVEFSQERTKDDFALPFLNIVNSPKQLKLVEGSQRGDIFNSVTNQRFPGKTGIMVVPCFYERVYLEWAARESGNSRPVNIYPVTSDILSKTHKEGNKDMLGDNGNYIENTAQHYVMVIEKDNIFPALIAMKSTQLKKSRQWNTVIQGNTAKNKDGQIFVKPDFSKFYQLSTTAESNKYGDWHGWKIESLNDFGNNDMGLYKSCRDFAKSVKAGAVNVQHGEEKEESTTPSQEEVPF